MSDVKDDVLAFIAEQKKKGQAVLINCLAGKSRSVSVAMMYLISVEGLKLKDAFKAIYENRPIIHPNSDLWNQLCVMANEYHTMTECVTQAMLGGNTTTNARYVPDSSGNAVKTVQNLDQLKEAFEHAQGMKKGWMKLTICKCAIEEEFATLLLKAPKRITLITIEENCTVSATAQRNLKMKLHIVFQAKT